MQAWQRCWDNGPDFVGRPYVMTLSVASLAHCWRSQLVQGRHALNRFQYRLNPVSSHVIGCIAFTGLIVHLGTPGNWQLYRDLLYFFGQEWTAFKAR